MAAELAGGLPDPGSRQIIIATSPRGLLPRMPDYAREYATRWFQSRGVQIVLSRVRPSPATDDENAMRSFAREDGQPPIRADVAFECTGGWRGSGCSALAAGGVTAEDEMNSYGQISVRDTLQFIRAPHIFAAGDCALVAGELDRLGAFAEKTAYAAMEAGRLAARNVGALIVARGRPGMARLETFPRNAFPLGRFPRLFAVSLYKHDGFLCIGPLVMTGYFAAFGKWFTEVLGCAAMAGNRFWEGLFSAVEKTIFFVTVVVQLLFVGQQ